MISIRTKIAVYRQDWTKYSRDCPPGSGYCEDQGVKFTLRHRIYFGPLCIRDKVLAEDDMPSWAWIREATLGSSGWRSALFDDPRITAS